MSVLPKVKTFSVDGVCALALPFRVENVNDLQVILSADCEPDRLLALGVDYIFEQRGKSAFEVHLVKPLVGFVTVLLLPCLDFKIQHFGAGIVPDLNAWAARVADRISGLEHMLGLADLAPIGGPRPAGLRDDLARALRLECPVGDLSPPVDGCFVLTFRGGVPSFAPYAPSDPFGGRLVGDVGGYITVKDVCAGAFDAADDCIGGLQSFDFSGDRADLRAYHFKDGPVSMLRASAFSRASTVTIAAIDGACVSIYVPLPI